ncbi:MAG: calcium-binding protein [Okeania sp. SIO2C9]|uniref:choice-of-anchor L domain-containing protein n=1 Tax=Okeania sp. SIO2C9 TaxID=2607791 RepID=UPI0013C11358|nr:choice-of-anchor L domain-containing protein [Okeania sp. SIO2C9]NEQ74263.1 calcium-binding protein [Okeania sp. SIO2C9]
MAFVEFDPTVDTVQDLVDAIVDPGASLTVIPDSINFEGAVVTLSPSVGGTSPNGIGQSSFYDGTLPLGIDPGILLTSGDGSPPDQNTEIGYSVEQLGNSDPDLQAVASSAFSGAGQVLDANILEFEFVIEDPTVRSITFDLIFGSDEFPEFSDTSFVDVAGVFVNGNNVALFNNDLTQPLSVISNNLSLGNFIDNANNILPIEYDGVSSKLTVFAPVQQGENTVKFGVADTGDQVLDSGLFIANLNTSNLDIGDPDSGGSGILLEIPGSESNDFLASDDPEAEIDEFFDGGDGDDGIASGNGNDVVDPGAGDDTVNAGNGDDFVAASAGNDRLNGDDGDDTVNGGGGQDTASGGNGDDEISGAGGSDQLLGGAGGDLMVGNSNNDILLGGTGDDTLLGGIGRDRLNGGAGNDVLTGGASVDRFIFNSNEAFQPEDFGIDEITDFSQTPGDIILLDRNSFTAINSDSGTGFSISDEFDVVNSDAAAATSDGVIVYNSSNGNLFYNPNGSASGFGNGAQFATLTGSPLLEADDFSIRN